MAEQKRVQKPRVVVEKNTRTEVIDEDKRTRAAKKAEALKAEMDEILDDIDEVLSSEETIQVDQYVQKGGE